MLKNIILYIVVFTVVGATSYFLQNFVLSTPPSYFGPLLIKAYSFHYLFSLTLVIVFLIASKNKSFFEQLGFIYMGVLVFKLTLVAAIFYPYLLGELVMPQLYRGLLMLPAIIFLFLEVFFISKIMGNKRL
ncbi:MULTISPECIES: DUF6168 family protein [Maribacter]|uniref:Uncharacterized protein n=1 Tax=Maribacter stanieri TaxID=440514 RepID=A0A1I6HVF5_9FLAO|nr:hypothetical protein SAMN04488010_0823 [Maribacter stanieri]